MLAPKLIMPIDNRPPAATHLKLEKLRKMG
jgi:hypothetical protein